MPNSSKRTRFERDLYRDAVLTHAKMLGGYEMAAIHYGLSPDEAFVHYPKWAAKWPASYREQVIAKIEGFVASPQRDA